MILCCRLLRDNCVWGWEPRNFTPYLPVRNQWNLLPFLLSILLYLSSQLVCMLSITAIEVAHSGFHLHHTFSYPIGLCQSRAPMGQVTLVNSTLLPPFGFFFFCYFYLSRHAAVPKFTCSGSLSLRTWFNATLKCLSWLFDTVILNMKTSKVSEQMVCVECIIKWRPCYGPLTH